MNLLNVILLLIIVIKSLEIEIPLRVVQKNPSIIKKKLLSSQQIFLPRTVNGLLFDFNDFSGIKGSRPLLPKIPLNSSKALVNDIKSTQPLIEFASTREATAVDDIKIQKLGMENFGDLQYVGNIALGSAKKKFRVIFDTGSAWSWVASENCLTCKNTGVKSFFSCKNSTSCEYTRYSTKQVYAKGEVEGRVVTEAIYLGDLKIQNQHLQLNKKMLGISGLQADGLLGFGFKGLSNNFTTVIENLKEQKQIDRAVFAFYLSDTNDNSTYRSTLVLGGVEPGKSRFVDAHEKFHVCNVSTTNYWTVTLDHIRVEAKGQVEEFVLGHKPENYKLVSTDALIDSGTSLITFPKYDIESLVTILQLHVGLCDFNPSLNQILCFSENLDAFPVFWISLCGKEFRLRPEDYANFFTMNEGKQVFILRFSNIDLNTRKFTILGSYFMKEYLSQFDMERRTISFARASRQKGEKNIN